MENSSPFGQEDEVNIWRQFITLHTKEYRTLDPVRFLAAHLEKTEEPVPVGYGDWETFCEKELEYTANTLVSIAVQIDPKGPFADRRQDILDSALRIAETFPMTLPRGSYGSRGYVIKQVFIAHFSVGEYRKCSELQELAAEWCSDEVIEKINEAIDDPIAFRRKLNQTNEEQ